MAGKDATSVERSNQGPGGNISDVLFPTFNFQTRYLAHFGQIWGKILDSLANLNLRLHIRSTTSVKMIVLQHRQGFADKRTRK